MSSGPSIAQGLASAAAAGIERLDAQLLLLHALGRPLADRAWLHAHDDEPVAAGAHALFQSLLARRGAGEPLAYLVGSKEFHGLALAVDARVLVPRPDTETLVDWALERIPAHATVRVLDLGTGSGAIALAIARARPQARVEAVDRSAAALEVAGANASRLGLRVGLRRADWLEDAGTGWDLIVSNPPYIGADDPHLPSLAHEPRDALVAGADGLDDIRRIAAQAPHHLAPGGWLLLEHGWQQAGAVRAILRASGLADVQTRRDLGGNERCSGAMRPADAG